MCRGLESLEARLTPAGPLVSYVLGGTAPEEARMHMADALLTPAVIERSNRNRRRPGLITSMMAARNVLPLWETGFATRLHTLSHPTMIIWGEQDRVFPLSVGEELHRTIPGSQLVRIPGAGHLPQWEQPDLVNSILFAYIQSPMSGDGTP